jgi:hypothetical protein
LWKTRFLAIEMALVLSHIRETLSKITQSLSWCAQSIGFGSNSYILSLCGGLGNCRSFLRRPTDNRRSKKMASTRSALSVNLTTSKISIEKANKIKRRRSRIPNSKLKSMIEIPEDSLNDSPM